MRSGGGQPRGSSQSRGLPEATLRADPPKHDRAGLAQSPVPGARGEGDAVLVLGGQGVQAAAWLALILVQGQAPHTQCLYVGKRGPGGLHREPVTMATGGARPLAEALEDCPDVWTVDRVTHTKP